MIKDRLKYTITLSSLTLTINAFSISAPKPALTFPSDFLWGTATASHQVEGWNDNNDWWKWEQDCHLKDCEKSLGAVEHWDRYPEDLDIAAQLKMNSYRMSIEWSRIEPRQGYFSLEAIDHYRSMLKAAHSRGMKTVVTLQHFTLPLWVVARNKGSWMDGELPDLFKLYSTFVVDNIGQDVDYWITVNEPNVNALTGYAAGASPPGYKKIGSAVRAYVNLLKAHAKAYHVIHGKFPNAKVSIAHHARIFQAGRSWNLFDHLIASWMSDFWNHQVLKAVKTGVFRFYIPFVLSHKESFPEIKGTLDYLGINYYSRDMVQLDLADPNKFRIFARKKAPKTDVGWEIYPFGLLRILRQMKMYHYPILITENGIADSQDKDRQKFICDHLTMVAQARNEGIPIFGYIHWSLLDNFEWGLGRGPRFGLVDIDYATQTRKIRPSALAIFPKTIETGILSGCSSKNDQ